MRRSSARSSRYRRRRRRRVARVDRHAGHVPHAVARDQQRTVAAERDEHVLQPARDQRFGGACRGVARIDRHARHDRELGFVRHEEFDGADPLEIEIGDRGRGVQQHRNAVACTEFDRVIDGVELDLELQHDQCAFGELRRGRVDVGRRQVAVGALDDQDAVARIGLDEDRRDAARHAGDLAHVRGVDAFAREVADRVVGEHVVADLRDHHDARAEAGGRDRLVRALAAAAQFEIRRLERFAPGGHACDVGHEVDHVAADNGDCLHLRLFLGMGCAAWVVGGGMHDMIIKSH